MNYEKITNEDIIKAERKSGFIALIILVIDLAIALIGQAILNHPGFDKNLGELMVMTGTFPIVTYIAISSFSRITGNELWKETRQDIAFLASVCLASTAGLTYLGTVVLSYLSTIL